MDNPRQKVPFVLAACEHGTVILNRLDWRPLSKTHVEFGVGTDILVHGAGDPDLIPILCGMLMARRDKRGPGVMVLDVGANIGTFSLEFGRAMVGWGMVLAFEPQERIYYALAGNLAINNLFNVRVINAAVSNKSGKIPIPRLNYEIPSNFGGIAMRDGLLRHSPGQEISYDPNEMDTVECYKIDD